MPGWLQGFAEHQPVTVMINTVRCLTQGSQAEALLGHSTGYYLLRALLWSAGIVARHQDVLSPPRRCERTQPRLCLPRSRACLAHTTVKSAALVSSVVSPSSAVVRTATCHRPRGDSSASARVMVAV